LNNQIHIMHKSFRSSATIKSLILLLSIIICQKASGNVNAIDFTKISYPKELQAQVDFLRDNDGLYNHWVHDWTNKIPKNTVVDNLISLYNGLDKLLAKNAETELLMGDIAHYLYNLEIEEYYQKAIDHYMRAKALRPEDYRVYWFLGNHYALSASQVLSIQTYQMAMRYLPKPTAHALFWADYAVACANASMPGTARYAAHQSSIIAGKTTYIEEQILGVTKNILHSPPPDTTMSSRDMWSITGRQANRLIFNNYVLGTRMAIDSTWVLDVGGFKNEMGYVTFNPHKATAKNGREIGYSILLLTKVPAPGQTLQQFFDKFTSQYKNRQAVDITANRFKNIISYEFKVPDVYTDIGGGHMYAMAIERGQPDFPGLTLEAPIEVPKQAGGEVKYYRSSRLYDRLRGKLYYFILLDTCEYIHDESLAVFKDFLDNLTLE
jgi:hypothetical protein